MKKICFMLVILFSMQNVSATTTVSQTFNDVFITYTTYKGETETHAVNVLRSNMGIYLYKLYFGEVTMYYYENFEDDFLKTYAEEYLNNIVYHANEINESNDDVWYYVAQYKIYEYLYDDYEIYFSDSDGNKISFLEDEIEQFESFMEERKYDIEEVDIYNGMKLYLDADYYVTQASTLVNTYSDYITIKFKHGTEASISLGYKFNESQDTVVYVNSDNFILFEGGGEFSEEQKIQVNLINTVTIAEDNPATGNVSPLFVILIGSPIIVLGALIYKIKRKIK